MRPQVCDVKESEEIRREAGLTAKQSKTTYVHTMPEHFENGQKCDGSKIGASVHTMPCSKVRIPFSKSTVFKICRQEMCHFRVNGRPIRHIFHRLQNGASIVQTQF